ncbi:MAG TPA: dTMP kinase [Fimbriimonas sp.]|nr:dTMP kinase [Fimbriimonas sp.]
MFVTFEGPEGAGKSTALQAVAEKLRSLGYGVTTTREPGAGEFGKKVRQLLLDGDEIPPESELLLFLADRANHVATIIRPALARGEIVLCDRYADSTLVYQGVARGLDPVFTKLGNQFATRGLLPAVTLLFDLDPVIGLQRLATGARADVNRLDREPLEFHQRVREGFLRLSEQEPHRFVVLDASGLPENLADASLDIILKRLEA